MNLTKSLVALALTGIFFTSCKQTESEAPVTDANGTKTEAIAGKTETASFNIEGMSCAVGCAKTIEKKLAGMEGVQSAKVDFDKKTATVEFDNAKQTPEKLVEAVEAAADGKTYKVSNVKSSGNHAMLYNGENEKEKDKKKKAKTKKGAKTEEKKACGDEKSAEGKPACCAAKKSCHS